LPCLKEKSSSVKNSKMTTKKLSIVVLISGSGSNLQAIIDAQQANFPAEIKAVISNKATAKGLDRATLAGIPTHVIAHQDYPDRESYDRELSKVIDSYSTQLVVLAGFMRILSHWFVSKYEGRLINIHPSLLPKFKGLNTHQQALNANEVLHGATVHFVTPELDGGPLILQTKVSIETTDTAESLAQRVLTKEHVIYPKAIELIALGRIKMNHGKTFLDGKVLDSPIEK